MTSARRPSPPLFFFSCSMQKIMEEIALRAAVFDNGISYWVINDTSSEAFKNAVVGMLSNVCFTDELQHYKYTLTWEKLMANKNNMLAVAVGYGQVAGCLCITKLENKLHLTSLCVKTHMRKRGIAEELISTAQRLDTTKSMSLTISSSRPLPSRLDIPSR